MRIAIMLATLVFSVPAALAQQLDTQEFLLKNGLKLIIREDHRAPVATVQIWYKVGSSYEHNGITGISHLLEHMQFKGTPAHPEGKFADIISASGGELNAFTYYDYTGYYESLPTTQVPVALALEADRMRNTTFSQANFDTELQVVIEERRLRTDDVPEALAYERFAATALTNSPYRNPVIGWPADLKAATLHDAKSWYDTWYAPNNATIIIVGDVNPKEAQAWVEKYFAGIKTSVLPVIKPQDEVKPLGEKQLTVKLPAKLPTLFMGLNAPVVKTEPEMKNIAALNVLMTLLDGGESARLSKHLIREKQVASFIDASYDPFSRMNSLIVISAYPKEGVSMQQLKEAIWQEIVALQTQPITEAELNRAKVQYKAQDIYSQDSISDQAMQIGGLESVGLSWKTKDAFLKAVEGVTPQDVQQAALRYFDKDGLTVGILESLPHEARTPS